MSKAGHSMGLNLNSWHTWKEKWWDFGYPPWQMLTWCLNWTWLNIGWRLKVEWQIFLMLLCSTRLDAGSRKYSFEILRLGFQKIGVLWSQQNVGVHHRLQCSSKSTIRKDWCKLTLSHEKLVMKVFFIAVRSW